ncbi:nucleotidyltransferase family protein [Candidatus Saccharibacteria bacterium]|jgi:lincosamide nucleotidyltransferase A/C/D/E|nr:nucleotidyltransferase family protein [Candidatus Saccharibacteria bacterium]MBP9813161.1 nucleotidyltransferase family protein [Candidatus Saccharibacteria bacterium]
MKASEVLNIYNYLKENNIDAWIDGGWCVDALLGQQTREHPDLDIAVNRKHNAKLRDLLKNKGFQEQRRNDSAEWMYILKNKNGLQVDIHVFEYDGNGNNVYGIEYPHGSLTGKGIINGQGVQCVAPEWMFKFKTAYKPKDKDKSDVNALARKFGYSVPDSHSLQK